MDLSAVTGFFSHISYDWIILGAIATFFVFDALRTGPAKITALAIALPIALLLSGAAEKALLIGSIAARDSQAMQSGIFVILTVILFIVFYRIVDSGRDSMHPLQSIAAGIACSVILIVTLLQVSSILSLWSVSDTIRSVFGESYRLWWLLGSYMVLAAVRG